jgi:hypothetical protein
MKSRKAQARERTIPVKLSEHEHGLIIDETLAGPNLSDRLESASNAEPVFAFTLDELYKLAGYMPDTLQEKGNFSESPTVLQLRGALIS